MRHLEGTLASTQDAPAVASRATGADLGAHRAHHYWDARLGRRDEGARFC